jgi:hypothetical protein
MISSLIVAAPLPHGYTWTLTTRLGELLSLAEARYGPRDRSYTLLGVEFCATGPRIWYPGDRRDVVIQLSLAALESERLALYQLAHECVHLLGPSGTANASNLEEGLAVAFSWFSVEHTLGIPGESLTDDPAYLAAGQRVRRLLAEDPGLIRRLRNLGSDLWRPRPEDLRAAWPGLAAEEVTYLTQPFVRGTARPPKSAAE